MLRWPEAPEVNSGASLKLRRPLVDVEAAAGPVRVGRTEDGAEVAQPGRTQLPEGARVLEVGFEIAGGSTPEERKRKATLLHKRILDAQSNRPVASATVVASSPALQGEETARTAELLQSVARERAVLVIEHDMEFVRSLARKVTVLHEGSVLCEGPVDQVQNDERVMEVYLGRSGDADADA